MSKKTNKSPERTIVTLIGAPGAGKRNLAELLREETGFTVFDLGFLIRQSMQEVKVPEHEKISFVGGEYGYDNKGRSNVPLDFMSRCALEATEESVIITGLHSIYDYARLNSAKGVRHIGVNVTEDDRSIREVNLLARRSAMTSDADKAYEGLVQGLYVARNSAGSNYRWLQEQADVVVTAGEMQNSSTGTTIMDNFDIAAWR